MLGGIPGLFPHGSMEQQVAAHGKALEYLGRVVDGDMATQSPSLRNEIKSLREELRSTSGAVRSLQHDLDVYKQEMLELSDQASAIVRTMDDRSRRDTWVNTAQFVTMAIIFLVLIFSLWV